jgi:serine/threonine-protein kinase
MSEDAAVVERAHERIGQVLRGKYRLDAVLGVGGMAAVYAATHRNRKRFAVKVLHAHVASRSSALRRFLREGYVANSVGHPGVVNVLDDDVAEDGSAFLVMELLDGITAEALRRATGNALPMDVVLTIADQLLDILEAAHLRSVIHRDIKPSNLFILRDGTLKVLDFGIARLLEPSGGVITTGATFGTPAFMAPEQALGRTTEIDGRADVWAAGATIFTLASGQLVHDGANAEQMFVNAATRPARSLSTIPSVDVAMASIVDRALSFERSDRWASAGAMRDAIRAEARPSDPLARAKLASLVESLVPDAPALSCTSVSSPIGTEIRRDQETRTMPTPGSMTATPEPKPKEAPRGQSGHRVGLGLLVLIGVGTSVALAAERIIAPRRDRSLTSAPSSGEPMPIQDARNVSSATSAPALTANQDASPPNASSRPARYVEAQPRVPSRPQTRVDAAPPSPIASTVDPFLVR